MLSVVVTGCNREMLVTVGRRRLTRHCARRAGFVTWSRPWHSATSATTATTAPTFPAKKRMRNGAIAVMRYVDDGYTIIIFESANLVSFPSANEIIDTRMLAYMNL